METPLFKLSDLTAGICCSGNIQALNMSLAGILNGVTVPPKIIVLLNGKISTGDFYTAQLCDMAAMVGSEIILVAAKTKGVREARDLLMNECATDYLWMLDDDAIPAYWCMTAYEIVLNKEGSKQYTFFAGSKNDVNNRRNYPVFSMEPRTSVDPEPNHNLVYFPFAGLFGEAFPAKSLDAGNVLLRMDRIRKSKITFTLFNEHRNASGDGTGFCLNLMNAGYEGAFVPSARAYHLEKPSGGFNEFEARAEMLLRTCDAKQWDSKVLKETFMPGTWPE